MDCNTERFDDFGGRRLGRKTDHVLGQGHRFRQFADGIVVPVGQEYTNIGFGKAAQLGCEVQSRIEIRPIAIEDVTRNQNENLPAVPTQDR